ncbi:MAG: hypothetical protein UY31_C0023G0009 [Candidatus Wolfebacteria bacterium GW2011_GWE1_48_7]|nr:MAG: hypothetical protein UX58_C0003G0077 [Candidatus Wolfebacteria bacterium GW2011_GWB2_46_69]KKU54071.1 MAG: hypothetical protein UX76_C0006G0037 [Candidatus Wolfebacteria bacterium GW2011_GWC1_47_103]KKU59258.1 MAG: hypothetical protein UX83_C0006G0028 [Candidatus Wolfebacteria bacterium GW2011_GWE2_47_12]KKU99601.1 MAG: hypothetical protein UY31_C0023G0009 [Candidatus Wolfebacteria bacterium GW2011_GWE1_48_7]
MDLVHGLGATSFEGAPLFAVDRSEFAERKTHDIAGLLVRPLVPEVDTVRLEIGDARTPRKEPKQFADDRLPQTLHAFGGDERKPLSEVEAHGPPAYSEIADAVGVAFTLSIVENILDEIKILLHVNLRFLV